MSFASRTHITQSAIESLEEYNLVRVEKQEGDEVIAGCNVKPSGHLKKNPLHLSIL